MSQSTSIVSAEIEEKFNELSNLTDQIAIINSDPESDVDDAIIEMQAFVGDLKEWDVEAMSQAERRYYLSHMSFHREIIAGIIAEARTLLIEKCRPHLKVLVSYHREFCSWLADLEKNYRK